MRSARALQLERGPHSPQLRNPMCSNEDPVQQKKKDPIFQSCIRTLAFDKVGDGRYKSLGGQHEADPYGSREYYSRVVSFSCSSSN